MAYRFVPFPMTLNDFEGHSPVAGLIKCNLTNICATFRAVRPSAIAELLVETSHQFDVSMQLLNGTSSQYKLTLFSAMSSWLTLAMKTDNN